MTDIAGSRAPCSDSSPRGLAHIGKASVSTPLVVRYTTTMAIELDNVDLAEITFVRHIFDSDDSSVFLVDIRNHECIMKVVSYSPKS